MKIKEVLLSIAETVYMGPGNSDESCAFHTLIIYPLRLMLFCIALMLVFGIVAAIAYHPWLLAVLWIFGFWFLGKKSQWGRK